ncbi:hypothetical protein HMPREF0080_00545 [Anaeroglobus geminatus F0357]|uniref:Uncharacterized protein n=1 Tax=Anaeroglobus geminatus F0357 TaxID=861450 RepID=G9YFY2_9FIRM|nr:hypothetical protein HMPREF0080_00545 [Anaeroglobus geminatus F0357]
MYFCDVLYDKRIIKICQFRISRTLLLIRVISLYFRIDMKRNSFGVSRDYVAWRTIDCQTADGAPV